MQEIAFRPVDSDRQEIQTIHKNVFIRTCRQEIQDILADLGPIRQAIPPMDWGDLILQVGVTAEALAQSSGGLGVFQTSGLPWPRIAAAIRCTGA